MNTLLVTAPTAPVVVRYVVVASASPNRAVEVLAKEEAVREVCAALNRWAYEAPPAFTYEEQDAWDLLNGS